MESNDDRIRKAIAAGNCVLFAGAGVGQQCGLDGWEAALRRLAGEVASRDKHIALAMQDRIARSELIGAASLLRHSGMNTQERVKALRTAFGGNATVGAIFDLVRIPFKAFVTTNYDDLIEQAYAGAHSRNLRHFGNSDSDLNAALQHPGPYVLHLHGTMDSPDTLVLGSDEYVRLSDSDDFRTYMVHLAQNHSIVILGYSLRDPDMGLLLEYLQRHTHLQWDRGAYFLYTDKSLAVAPLVERNINPVLFADRDALWRYVTNLSLNQPAQEPEVQQIVSSAPGHYEKLKSSIAHTLAQAKVMGDLGGHADNVYAALCTGVIADAGGKSAPVPLATLSNRLEGLFHVKPHRAREIAEKAVNLLAVYKLAVRTEDAVQLTEDQSATAMSSVIIELARLIANRVDVRSGIQVKADNELGEFILRFLAEEAFDLIECRLQGNRGHTVRQDERARVLAGKLLGRLTSSARDATCAALLRLLRSPSPDEEPVVVRVVNTVASIEIAMHQVTLSAMTGFDSVATAFVDANILLPTILADHPIHPFYASTIKAARGREVDVVVLREFLNEVISHKTIARAKMEEPELTGKDRFRDYITLYGPAGVNAFIGAYAGALAKGSDETFQDFLARVAPYTSEDELQKFIVNLGIGVVPKDQYAQNPHLKQLRLTLQSAYASSLGKHSDKTSPLVAHEAVQLAAILQSAAEFRPAWFVTADKGLVTAVREAVAFESDDPTWAQILTCMLTPVEFAHYMTFAGGRQVDWTGYSHALWSSSQSDTMSNFMDYFTDRFLRERNSELTKNLPAALAEVRKLIESAMMPDIERMLGDEGNRIRVFSMLGKFEPKFYEIMAKYKRA